MKTIEKITSLRAQMRKYSLAAYIVPGTDPHASEYVTEHWRERMWISGFTGSAGTAVVTLDKGGLWTDSRYFLQAEMQLKNSGLSLMKEGLADTPSIAEWLKQQLKPGANVGVNPEMFSNNGYVALQNELQEADIHLMPVDLIQPIWVERPALPTTPFYVMDLKYTGKSVTEKLTELRREMKQRHADVYVISSLDEIAWLFNIRGTDVDYNPLVIAYAIVTQGDATLFVMPEKLTAETMKYLVNNKVAVADYECIINAVKKIDANDAVLYDGAKLNRALWNAIPKGCKKVECASLVAQLKSLKNEVELEGTRKAMKQDGKALVRFFMWLEENVGKQNLSEYDLMMRLKECRAEGDNFMGESFGTIAGYNANGAIVHYSADEHNCAMVEKQGMLLLDSGGQYMDGTTDITRTVTLGEPTEQQKVDYTLVLKGHIALACAKFPEGTRGVQLDVLARQFLWQNGLSYGHGTGHGVGHFLCVHEGPQNIRTDLNPTPLQVGMLLSDEPGVYRAGEYGIRIENLVAVKQGERTPFANFLEFETLTLYPYDQKLIQWDLLSKAEVDWINAYHQRVEEELTPLLNDEEAAWLKEKCKQH